MHFAGWQWVEWLHQVILDYFLACKIVDIHTNGTQSEIKELSKLIQDQIWEQPCVIALGLLDPINGGRLLLELIIANRRTAQLAFENQDDIRGEQIANFIVTQTTNNESTNIALSQVANTLPYYPIVQNLFKCFRSTDDATRIEIAEAISSMVIKYQPLTKDDKNDTSVYRFWHFKEISPIRDFDRLRIQAAVKRGFELLTTWSVNKSDEVRFCAGKGLWETDKGHAAETLKGILLTGDDRMKIKVKELMYRWGIR